MAKGRSGPNAHRANQQRIEAGWNLVTQAGNLGQPSKAELRASIPEYDESKVRKVPAKAPSKSKKRP